MTDKGINHGATAQCQSLSFYLQSTELHLRFLSRAKFESIAAFVVSISVLSRVCHLAKTTREEVREARGSACYIVHEQS